MRHLSALLIGVCALALASAADAAASWQAGGSAPAYARAETMPAGGTPLASLSEGGVTVSWPAVTLADGSAPEGYVVRRYAASGEAAAIGAGCAGTIAALSCTEAAVPPGYWRYAVTPVLRGWRGAESAASAPLGVPLTIATSAWDLRDASSGTEANASEPTAFAADERTYETQSFGKSFSAGRYVEWTYDAPLEAGLATSSVSFDFRFAAGGASDVACFWFEAIGAGGEALGTHGSTEPGGAGSPWCTGTAYKLVSTPLPEVSGSTLANGLRIRVHGYESGNRPILVDEATVSGTAAPSQTFTLHETALVDAAAVGGRPKTIPWALASAGDGAVYTSEAKWPSAFSASRYLRLSFPSYVPAGDAVSGVSFVHSYRSAGGSLCWYFEVYAGGSLIGTHGSAASPVSCNSSTSSFVTDTVPLPEVTTAAQADALTIRMYFDSAGSKQGEDDLAQLRIGYVP